MAKKKKIPSAMRDLVLERDGFMCVYCLRTGELEADHVIPESDFGHTHPDNLVTSCEWCNSRKGQIDLDLFCIYVARRGLGGGDARRIEERVLGQLAIYIEWPPKK